MTSGDPDAQATRRAVWSRHWASGASHSCAGSYGNTYGGAIAAFWRAVHDETPSGSRLLDIATGSGAVPRLWRQWREGDRWDAVDLAGVTPAWARDAGPMLRFHAGVRAEALPFPDASFDLVASQYGIEYADLPRAFDELLRVRQPHGRVALVMHHAGSRPVALAAIELAHLDWALAADGLVGACDDMVGPAAQASTAEGRARLARDPAAEAARVRFNAAQLALRERRGGAGGADGADVLHEVQDAVARVVETALRAGEAPARSALERLKQTLADHRWRLQELRAHALDEAALHALVVRLETAGLQVRIGTVNEGAYLMGWTLQAAPAGAVDSAAPADRTAAAPQRSPDAWFNLGQAHWWERRFEAALEAYQAALDGGLRAPEEAHLNRAVILARHLERPDDAQRELERALTLNPRCVPALLNLGSLCEQRGAPDEALRWYGELLEIDPRHALALSRLAGLRTVPAADDPLIARLAAAVAEPGRSAAERADLGFGLGKALDDVGRFDEAFAAYTAANAASRQAATPPARYDAAAEAARIDRLIAAFPRPAAAAASIAASPPPIFICGMFRSGSTLIEQVLAGHPRITAGGELDLLPALAAEHLPAGRPWPVLEQPALLATLAGDYLQALQRRFPTADRVTDKRPDNFLHIGLIKALFPTARIVYTRRDALDNCLSAFFLHLGHDMPWALDLRDAGHWYRQHERLMAHWLGGWGDDIHTVDYDRFVVDPETEARRLLDFCGLDWHPACLDFHRRADRVQTASLWQVRQPLYRRASGRWRNYARHLAGLREALGLPPHTSG